MGFNLFPE